MIMLFVDISIRYKTFVLIIYHLDLRLLLFTIRIVCIFAFIQSITGVQQSLQVYKLLLLLPEAITILKTLSRKARFTNEQFRAYSRSTCSGFTSEG